MDNGFNNTCNQFDFEESNAYNIVFNIFLFLAKEALDIQRAYVKDLREVPGSYFVSRCIDNAFRAVFFDGDNAREVFEQEVESIDREIARKRQELGLD